MDWPAGPHALPTVRRCFYPTFWEKGRRYRKITPCWGSLWVDGWQATCFSPCLPGRQDFISQSCKHRSLIFGAVYIILAVLMIYTSLRKTENKCLVNYLGKPLIPLALGFLTGINFCPPFLMAFTEASSIVNLGQCILFFFMFFLGTTLFFLPLPLVGGLERFLLLKNIGKLAAILIAVYYLYTGLVMIGGG